VHSELHIRKKSLGQRAYKFLVHSALQSNEQSVMLKGMGNEALIRIAAFGGSFLTFALLESIAARRQRTLGRSERWTGNLGISLLNSLLMRVVFPGAEAGVAAAVYGEGFGLFGLLNPPYWLQVAGTLVLLDIVLYLQHVLFHTLPLLARIHRMHHIDPELDSSSGLRFHPLEMLISTGLKIAVVLLLGAPPLAVLLFAVILNTASIFNHANLRLPISFDRRLRLLLVTPDMHRVHHSVIREERNSNFGFSVSWWDRLLGTYRAQPRDGHLGMVIGFPGVAGRRATGLLWMLLHPFLPAPGSAQRRRAEEPSAER
jgi:sterol desaturase/sphingolipid hydroxylase (fatty acid hydroxylase superfamily)